MLRVFPREGVSVERNFVVRRWTLLSNLVHFHILDIAGLATDAILFHLICNNSPSICSVVAPDKGLQTLPFVLRGPGPRQDKQVLH